MTKLLLIGDVHGDVKKYKDIVDCSGCDVSIQLGDFGFKDQHDWFLENMNTSTNKILFGNHDYLPYKNNPHSLGSYGYNKDLSLFWVRGAYSVDKMLRKEKGFDWFEDEEISSLLVDDIIDLYLKSKPKIVISHDCPLEIKNYLLGNGKGVNTFTGNLLSQLFYLHQPIQWFFGHYHKTFEIVKDKTYFRCLDITESYLLNI